MPPLDLRLRNLENGELLMASFDDEIDAARWLMDRPKWMEVLGVATFGLPKEVYVMLRTASRALEADEVEVVKRIEAAEAEAQRKAEEDERRRDEEEMAAYKESQRTADPNRPMALQWTPEGGYRNTDPFDPREITDAAREAVAAWVAERNDWVKDRELTVVEANVLVLPGDVPPGASRVLPGGQFVPGAITPAKPAG